MPVGDTVIMQKSFNDPVPPLVGIVAVDAEDGSPVDVLWRNGELSSAIPTAQLRKLFPAVGTSSGYVGSWVQVAAFPEPEEGELEKSGATSGVVVEVYGENAFGEADPDPDFAGLVIATENGEGSFYTQIDLSEPSAFPFITQPSRRAV